MEAKAPWARLLLVYGDQPFWPVGAWHIFAVLEGEGIGDFPRITTTATGGTGFGLGCTAGAWARAVASTISNSIAKQFKGEKIRAGIGPPGEYNLKNWTLLKNGEAKGCLPLHAQN